MYEIYDRQKEIGEAIRAGGKGSGKSSGCRATAEQCRKLGGCLISLAETRFQD